MNRDIEGFLEEYEQFARLLHEYQTSYEFGLQQDARKQAEDRNSILTELNALEAETQSQVARLDGSVRSQLERLGNITASINAYEAPLNAKKLEKAKRERVEQRQEEERQRQIRAAEQDVRQMSQNNTGTEADTDQENNSDDGNTVDDCAATDDGQRSEPLYASQTLQDQVRDTISSIDAIRESKLPEPLAKAADFLNLPFRRKAYAKIASSRDRLDEMIVTAAQELGRDRALGQASIDASGTRRVESLRTRNAQLEASRKATRDEYSLTLKRLLVDGLERTFVGDTIYANAETQLGGYLSTYSDSHETTNAPDTFFLGLLNQPARAQDDGTLHAFLAQVLPSGIYDNGTVLVPITLSRYFAKPFCLSFFSEHVDGVYPLFSNYALQLMRLFNEEVISTYLVDCANVGGRYAEFSTYESDDEDKRVCIIRTPDELGNVLNKLAEYVIESNSIYLKNVYRGVEEYNAASSIKRELRALFISNLGELKNEDIATLTTIARNGCRCGVLVFIGVSTDEFQASGVITQQHASAVNNLAALCNRIYMDSHGNLGFGNGRPAFFAPPAIGAAKAAAIVERAVRNSGKQTIIPLEDHLPQGTDILTGNCRKHLIVPIGRTPQGDEYSLDFHKDAAYMLMGGNPSAGKSSLLHTIILQCITRYKPEDLVIYIADFKDGSEFDVYANVGVKSVQAVLDDSEEDLATSFLAFVTKEIERRLACFKELSDKTGMSVRNIEEFYEVNDGAGELVERIPRMLLIIDEFQSLYTGNRATGELTNWLVRMGRTAGVFLIMSSQRSQADSNAMSSSFGGQTKEYFIYRLMFKLPYSGAKEIMSDRCSDTGRENPALRKAQTLKPGQAIVNPNMGATEEDNQLIQCYYPSSSIIDAISKLMVQEQGRNEHSIILASEKPVDPDTRPASHDIVLGESNRFHADGANDDDAFSDDIYVSMDPSAGALDVFGITEQAYASVLQSCWIALSAQHDRCACVVLGTGKGVRALERSVEEITILSDDETFIQMLEDLRGDGRFVLACIVNPYDYPSMCRDSIGRSGDGVAFIESLINGNDAFLLVCAENTKKIREKAVWCDADIPCRVLLAGNPASIRLAMTSDAGDKIKDGQFNVIRSNVLKAYYYNKDTNKLGRMRLYPVIRYITRSHIGEIVFEHEGESNNVNEQEKPQQTNGEIPGDGFCGLTGN